MNGFGAMLKDYLDFYKISQTDFADRLGISFKHLNEIVNDNTNISEELMLKISLITDIDVNLILFVENKKRMYNYLIKKYETLEKSEELFKEYYLKELTNKGWIILKDKESIVQKALDLLEFLKISNYDNVDSYIDKRFLFKKKDDANLTKIFLWIKRCDIISKNQSVNEYNKNNYKLLLNELELERNKKFNKNSIIRLFNKYGIYLVIEDALDGTKVRGVTTVKKDNPAIYITTYLKEKSSFYFTLYHELNHVKTNFNKAKSKVIIETDDNYEKECDLYALNQMINSNIYDSIINNMKDRDKLCKKYNIPLCFLYTRLAYDGYIKYNSKEYLDNLEKI